jgi:hypothetical protein
MNEWSCVLWSNELVPNEKLDLLTTQLHFG